jgi:hypothetical protein
MGDKMHFFSLALDTAAHRHHARRHHSGPELLEQLQPDDDIGDAGLIFERDEDGAFGGARPLADQDKACGFGPTAIARLHCVGAAHDAAIGQICAEKWSAPFEVIHPQ